MENAWLASDEQAAAGAAGREHPSDHCCRPRQLADGCPEHAPPLVREKIFYPRRAALLRSRHRTWVSVALWAGQGRALPARPGSWAGLWAEGRRLAFP